MDRTLYQYLKNLAKESGQTIYVATQAKRPPGSEVRPHMLINNDVVIIDYPDYLREER